MNTRFEIRVYPENETQVEALVNLGFSRDWEYEPFRMRTDDWENVDVVLHTLVEDNFTCSWTLENKAD